MKVKNIFFCLVALGLAMNLIALAVDKNNGPAVVWGEESEDVWVVGTANHPNNTLDNTAIEMIFGTNEDTWIIGTNR
jgi:hypothetical protein